VKDCLLEAYRRSGEMERARALLEAPPALLGGLSGGSLSFFLAAWLSEPDTARARGPCLVVTASEEEADELAEELEVFAPGAAIVFPAWDSLFLEGSTPDPDTFRDRLAAVEGLLSACPPRVVLAPLQALIQPLPGAEELRSARLPLRAGQALRPGELARLLVERGYRHVPLVEAPGEFSLRGDVFDLFPSASRRPARLEFFGDSLESIRDFDSATQRSVPDSHRGETTLLLPSLAEVFRACFRGREALLFDYLPPGSTVLLKEAAAVREKAEKVLQNLLGDEAETARRLFFERLESSRTVLAGALPAPAAEEALTLRFGTVERFHGGDLGAVFGALALRLDSGYRLRVYCENVAEALRFRDLLRDHGLEAGEGLEVAVGLLRRGFEIVELQAIVLTCRELFDRHIVRRLRRRTAPARAIQSFLELEKGDHVVHLTHGIGRYLGMETFAKDGVEQEFLALEFRDGVKLYVPVSKIDLVQKYIGSGDHQPVLDRIGGAAWGRKKEAVEAALLDMASELLEIQALRRERPGIAFPADSEWQRQFEASFPFEDTPDQVAVTEAIKEDMQAARPMDRLICGDVGYGKTELAMRATFKAVDGGKQVAVLVPTTVLAEQHCRTFRERMAEFPVAIEVLSRFRTPARQRAIIERAAAGKIDVLIGTHRLLSDDVSFRELGLVIIDEEQRFGVAHKEKLKQMRSQVDVLTLSATPIPRTLHMALLGIRDISSLTTAPEGRSPIHTEICHFDRRQIREAVIRELNRDGQAYFIHNRIYDIESILAELQVVVPEARIDFVHGQMNEHLLEEKMLLFLERGLDVLISTTIIENGIDIPSVNTIFINEADHYGLADLHQLRGRVGRYRHQAYCYLLLPEHRHANPDAQKRLQALVEFSGLGAGFQIAMRDLEIRGAGNILGKEQSGHIAAVGYDMYCRLLEKCVHTLKNEPYSEPVSVEVDLALKAYIPDAYISDPARKLEIYRRIASAESDEAVRGAGDELLDRYGAFPPPVRRLLELQSFRLMCSRRGMEYIGREEDNVILEGGDGLRSLLESCPRRVVVLGARKVAIPLFDRERREGPGIDDERLFEMLAEWLRTGVYPAFGPRPRRFVDIGTGGGRVALERRKKER
jgi:transcription-repair coupling factor (superfamily II helicase)